MKKYLKVIGLISVGSILFACSNNNQGNSSSETTTPVWVEEVTPRTIEEYITTTGTAKAMQTITLTSESSGKYILQRNPRTGKTFKLGDKVKVGETIVRLDNKNYENDIQLESKKLNVDITEKEWEGQKLLLEKGGATQKDVNNAYASYINAKLALESAHINIDKLNIKAPFSGVIVDLPYFTPDVEIASGSTIASIMDYSKMYMETQFPESTLSKLEVGQKVKVTNYNIEGDTLKGTLTQLSPAINEDTRTFSGYILIENPKLKLRPGMFAKADIITVSKENVLAIPKDIIITRRGNKVVFTVESAAAIQKSIKTGISNDTYIEVENGLEDGDQVVIKGYDWLRDRSKVNVKK